MAIEALDRSPVIPDVERSGGFLSRFNGKNAIRTAVAGGALGLIALGTTACGSPGPGPVVPKLPTPDVSTPVLKAPADVDAFVPADVSTPSGSLHDQVKAQADACWSNNDPSNVHVALRAGASTTLTELGASMDLSGPAKAAVTDEQNAGVNKVTANRETCFEDAIRGDASSFKSYLQGDAGQADLTTGANAADVAQAYKVMRKSADDSSADTDAGNRRANAANEEAAAHSGIETSVGNSAAANALRSAAADIRSQETPYRNASAQDASSINTANTWVATYNAQANLGRTVGSDATIAGDLVNKADCLYQSAANGGGSEVNTWCNYAGTPQDFSVEGLNTYGNQIARALFDNFTTTSKAVTATNTDVGNLKLDAIADKSGPEAAAISKFLTDNGYDWGIGAGANNTRVPSPARAKYFHDNFAVPASNAAVADNASGTSAYNQAVGVSSDWATKSQGYATDKAKQDAQVSSLEGQANAKTAPIGSAESDADARIFSLITGRV